MVSLLYRKAWLAHGTLIFLAVHCLIDLGSCVSVNIMMRLSLLNSLIKPCLLYRCKVGGRHKSLVADVRLILLLKRGRALHILMVRHLIVL